MLLVMIFQILTLNKKRGLLVPALNTHLDIYVPANQARSFDGNESIAALFYTDLVSKIVGYRP